MLSSISILLITWCSEFNLFITCYTRHPLHSRAGQGFHDNITLIQRAMQQKEETEGEERLAPECVVLSLDACAEVKLCRLCLVDYLHLCGKFTGNCTCFDVNHFKGMQDSL